MPKLKGDKHLIPSTVFYENKNQLYLLRDILRSFKDGNHILLVGNQGVGKNKLIDGLLQLLEAPREYLQLHRDSTVQSITVQVCIQVYQVCVQVYQVCIQVYQVCIQEYQVCIQVYQACVQVYQVCIQVYQVCIQVHQVCIQ